MISPPFRKVLLIGWDAADWKVITPLLDAGKMPNLEKLVNQGVMGNLATLYPILSPMLWTSIATGKRAHKHGIHGFTEPDPQTGGVRPITNLNRKTKAIWNILNQNGLRSQVVGWWPSHPAEPINGVMVSNHYQQAMGGLDQPWPIRPGTVHPPRLAEALAEFRVHPHELEGEQLQPFVPRAAEIDQEKDKRLFSVAKILAEISSVHAAATALMQLEPWDFVAVYYDGIDHFGHGFMKYHPPRLDWIEEEDFDLYKEVVNTAYQYHDLMLGSLMHLAGEDATVILCSDHGFHPDHLRPRELPNEPAGPAAEHRHFGVFAMTGPGVRKDELVFGSNLLDIAPTILTLYGLPIGRDMDGKPLLSALVEPGKVEFIDSWDAVPGDAGTHRNMDMAVDAGDAQEAIKQLVELGYLDPPDADQAKAVAQTVREQRYNLARDYIDCRKHHEAMLILQSLWEEFPDESRFGVLIFQSLLALDRTEEAEAALDRLVREKQRYADEALLGLEQLKREWKDKSPEDLKVDEKQRANKLIKRAGVNSATFAWLRGQLLSAQGKPERALEALAEAETAQTHHLPTLYQKQGEILLQLRRRREAAARFNKALEIDPVNPAPYLGLSRCRLSLGLWREALDAATASLGMLYHQPLAHFYCAFALAKLGRREEAITAYQTALRLNPNFPAAHRQLARLHGHMKELDLAATHRKLAWKILAGREEWAADQAEPQGDRMEVLTEQFPCLPLFKRGTEGDSLGGAMDRAQEIPPNPPFAKGGAGTKGQAPSFMPSPTVEPVNNVDPDWILMQTASLGVLEQPTPGGNAVESSQKTLSVGRQAFAAIGPEPGAGRHGDAGLPFNSTASSTEQERLSADEVVIVSGLPRSGTSMMMQMLAAGGLPVLTDEFRQADEDNPRGYYELEIARKLRQDASWLNGAGGKAFKLVAQLLPFLPPGRPYRIVFMERPLGEIVASQSAMLRRLNREGGRLSERQLAHTYWRQLQTVRGELNRFGGRISMLGVDYQRTLEDPEAAASRLNAFLGGGFDEKAMAAAVAPELRRQR